MGNADGSTTVLFDPVVSIRGARTSVARHRRKRNQALFEVAQHVVVPNALPMFQDKLPKITPRKWERMRKDPKVTRMPGICLL